jgi:ABC-type uncharacterized transport system permease subunit
MPHSALFWVAAGLYLALAYFCWPGRAACKPGLFNRLLPLLPLGLHVYLLQADMVVDGGISLGFAASVSAMMALTVLLYSVAAWRYPLGALQSFVLALAGLAVLLEGLMPHAGHAETGTPISGLHLLMAFGAYGTFTIAALHAALIAVAEKHLHKPVPPKLVAGLPPLLTLEKLLFRMIELGFIILTLTLVSGFLFSEALYGRAVTFTHMTVFGLASWLIFAALLVGRRVKGWRGRTAIYWTLAGFVTLLLSYVGVKFVLEVVLGRA